MSVQSATKPHKVVNEGGVTRIYDTPTRTVYVADFELGRALAFWATAQITTALMAWDAFYFWPGIWGVIMHFIASFFIAARCSRLRSEAGFWNESLRWLLAGPAIFLGPQLVAHMVASEGAFGLFIRGGYWIFVSYAVLIFSTTSAETWAGKRGAEKKALPRALVSIDDLRARRSRIQSDRSRLSSLTVFTADTPPLRAAWESKKTAEIEALLKAGDAHTRQSWETAIGVFNAAKDDVDLGRSRIRHLVKDAEKALASYTIDYASITANRSGTLAGYMHRAALPPKKLAQKLDYAAGAGRALGSGLSGNTPWQVSAAFVATAFVMTAINRSKLLRQLTDLQGKLKEQGQVVLGDITLIGTELTTRMIPQFEDMLSVISQLEAELRGLHAAEERSGDAAAQAKAFQLACALYEAKYLLEMKAGN